MKKGRLLTVFTVLAMSAGMTAGLCACGDDEEEAHTHAYGAATYSWAQTTDGWNCTATKKCSANDDTVTETVAAVITATTATHLTAGDTTYTATFTKDGFAAQTKNVSAEKLPHTFGKAEYTWESEDDGYTYTCTATVTCTETGCAEEADATIEEVGDVSVKNTAYDDEDKTTGFTCGESVWYTFTAVFEDEHFTEQIKSEGIKKYPHTYGDWYISQAPTMEATGKLSRTCEKCSEVEVDEETEVPVLSDTTFWTKNEGESVAAPTLNTAAYDVYECEYGKVKFKTANKLPAPYDNKEYYQLEYAFDDVDKLNKTINAYPRTGVIGGSVLTFTDNVAAGKMAPFNGKEVVILSKDENTFNGKIDIVVNTKKADGTITDTQTFAGVCDEESGIIAFSDRVHSVIILTTHSVEKTFKVKDDTPGAEEDAMKDVIGRIPDTNSVKASVFADYAIAITHTYAADKSVNVFYYDDAVHMGVTFKNAKEGGEDVAAENAYAAEKLYVYEGSALVAGFVKKGEALTETDGHEGSYNGVVLDGIGGATYDSKPYAYTWVGAEILFTMTDAEQTEYYEIVTNGEDGYSVNKPMVTLTITSDKEAQNGGETIATFEVNKNAKASLPGLTTADNSAFIGWYLDAEFEETAANHIFTENATVYLRWAKAITVTLNYGDGATTATIATGETITIAELLASDDTAKTWSFDINAIEGKYFVGWYTDSEYTNSVTTTTGIVAPAGSDAVQLYAKWENLPAYYGSYKLFDLGSSVDGSYSGSKQFTINEHNEISGGITGTVVSYDEATGKIAWSNGTNEYVLFYDKASGMMLGDYSDFSTATTVNPKEVYFGVKGVTDKSGYANYGVRGESSNAWLMRFFKYQDHVALLYNNTFTSAITITDSQGTELAFADIRNSKTFVVKDSAGALIVARTSTTDNFGAGNVTMALDAYFGTYTLAENDDLVIDGTGKFIWGAKSGTYTEKSAGVLAAYVVVEEKNVEYYEFTVDTAAKTYTSVKPTVHIVYVSEYSTEAAIDANVNIAFALPAPTHTTHLFRYWTIGGVEVELTEGEFIPTGSEEITMTAVWKLHRTVTVHYNDGTTKDIVVDCGDGETVKLDTPAYKKHVFEGWFTNASFTEGTEWTSEETVVSADIDLYAKWKAAAYVDEFKGYYVTNGNINSTASNSSYIGTAGSGKTLLELTGISAILKGTALPFSDCSSLSASDKVEATVDETNHTIVLKVTKGSTTYIYNGVIDPVTGIIVANYTKDKTDFSGGVVFLLPAGINKSGTGNYTSTWDGKSVVFDYVDEEENVHTIYIVRGETTQIYFDAVITAENGDRLAMNAVAKSEYIKIAASAETGADVLFEGGYNGSKIVAFDKYKGTYADNGSYGNIVVNGVGGITIGGKKDKYTVASENHLTATVGGVYYEITVNVEAHTCTVTAPKGNISFVFANATLRFNEAEVTSGNKIAQGIKVKFTLPVPTPVPGYQFIGWFTASDFSGTAITEYTLEASTDDVVLHARIQEMPKWASKDTAQELAFSGNAATISGETSKLNSTYWAKITVTETSLYTFGSSDYPVKTSGTESSKYYGRYAVVKADGTAVSEAISFSSSKQVMLDAGTYYVQINLGGKVLSVTAEKDFFGTFTIDVTASEIASYALGTETTTAGGGYVYAVELTAGTAYTWSWSRETQSNFCPMEIYSDAGLKTAAVPTNGSGTAQWANSKSADFTPTATGTYYIVIKEALTFSIGVKA